MRNIKSLGIALLLLLCSACAKESRNETVPSAYHKITAEEAAAMMEKESGWFVIDVRRADEYASGHIPGAVNVPNESIGTEKPAALPDTDQILLIHCRTGVRSKQASDKLVSIGYTNIYDFGGIVDWKGELVTGASPYPEDQLP